MNFGVPSLQPILEPNKNTGFHLKDYGVHDTFSFGFNNVKSQMEPCHPIELSEKNYLANEEKMQMSILRNSQGLHAPMRLAAELRATRSIGRLPFLESSGLSSATLRCADDTIDFTDILNLPEQQERLFIPHVVMEHKLGIL